MPRVQRIADGYVRLTDRESGLRDLLTDVLVYAQIEEGHAGDLGHWRPSTPSCRADFWRSLDQERMAKSAETLSDASSCHPLRAASGRGRSRVEPSP